MAKGNPKGIAAWEHLPGKRAASMVGTACQDLAARLEVVRGYRPREIGRIGAGVRREDVDLRLALDWALARMKREGRDLEILRRFGLGEENREPVGGA